MGQTIGEWFHICYQKIKKIRKLVICPLRSFNVILAITNSLNKRIPWNHFRTICLDLKSKICSLESTRKCLVFWNLQTICLGLKAIICSTSGLGYCGLFLLSSSSRTTFVTELEGRVTTCCRAKSLMIKKKNHVIIISQNLGGMDGCGQFQTKHV